ncbi:MAG TPA: VWA domain-containing protein [Anaerolineales bacterium]|nr:VWA domain-containing protein [Anaerolineales bacterium]
MDLLWPGFLFLFGLIPLIVAAYIWILRRRRRYTVRYSSLSLIRDVLPRQSWVRRHLPFILFALALTSLVMAMSRPVARVQIPVGQNIVILALDVSLSMCSTDIPPNRLEAAKAAAQSFTERQDPNTQIGIVAFAGFAGLIQAPTSDQGLLQGAIERLVPARRTAIGSAILESLDAIAEMDQRVAPIFENSPSGILPTPVPEGEYVPHIIVLLTDGVTTSGPFPLDAAQLAVDRGVRVYTIGFGTESETSPFGGPQCQDAVFFGGSFGGGSFGGGGRGFSRAIDEQTLIQIADMTGGAYSSATSASELQNVFQNLPSFLITTEETMEISVMFIAVGAALIALAILLSLIWNPFL